MSGAGAAAPLMLSVSGCRGIVGASLTEDVAARFAGAFVGFLREERGAPAPTVVFGRDGRAGGEGLRDAVTKALARLGCRVIDLDVAMTPTVGVMVDRHKAHGGLVLTASHNPAEWNGLKCLVVGPGGVGAHAPGIAEAGRIIERFGSGALEKSAAGGAVERDAGGARAHVEKTLAAVGRVVPIETIRAKAFKVVVDSVNCSGAEGARLLLEALGCRLTHLNADASGVFPHAAEPTRENLASVEARARGLGADATFAQDPDADRLAILDERGEYIGEEYTLVLAAMAVGKSARVFAANLSTSRMLDDVAAGMGVRVVRTPVGEAHVVDGMARAKSALGGEGNGGVIWPEVVWIRDSLSAMALTLALMAREGKRVSELVASIPAYVIEKRKAPVREGLAAKASDALAKHYAGVAGARVDRQDGVRVDVGGAWVHVRASNTEPIMRLIAEARDEAGARALLDEAAGVVATLG